MTASAELTELTKRHKVHQIRSGTSHRFIDISIVESCVRFFVRQYKFAKHSWREAFLQQPKGQIKWENKQFDIVAQVPSDLTEITSLVDRAYVAKYGITYYLMRLTFNTKKHLASTLELVPTN